MSKELQELEKQVQELKKKVEDLNKINQLKNEIKKLEEDIKKLEAGEILPQVHVYPLFQQFYVCQTGYHNYPHYLTNYIPRICISCGHRERPYSLGSAETLSTAGTGNSFTQYLIPMSGNIARVDYGSN